MSRRPTFLFDEPNFRAEMQEQLQSSIRLGTQIVGSHGPLEFFAAKIIFSQKLARGTTFEVSVISSSLIGLASGERVASVRLF
jgi:hypothetical protein